jgi:threonylcarbamoyladenosine tRNA methylthiotransferase MtaB
VSEKTPARGPEVVTFGCRLNAYESEVVRDLLRDEDPNSLVVVNTCAVTVEAERQARQTIRKLRRDRPDARIIVTGCAAQIDPDRYAAMPEVSRVVGNGDKFQAASYAEEGPRLLVSDIMAVRETAPHLANGFGERTRAFLQVQQGCDHRCTFCIIPYGRGNSRSVPAGAVVEQVRELAAKGLREVVLTGVDVTSWGGDLPGKPSLGQLVRRILKLVPELPRLRLSSLDPVEIDEDLWRALAEEPRLMPHLHLSVQAGADLILKRMKRRHLRADVIAVSRRARALRPDVAFGADFIAGFPTETEEHFADTLDLVEAADLTYLHVFPYSARPGTPAAKIPGLPGPVIRERAARLRALGDQQLARHLDRQIGQSADLLIEADGAGRTERWTPVVDFPGSAGAINRVVLTGRRGLALEARAA